MVENHAITMKRKKSRAHMWMLSLLEITTSTKNASLSPLPNFKLERTHVSILVLRKMGKQLLWVGIFVALKIYFTQKSNTAVVNSHRFKFKAKMIAGKSFCLNSFLLCSELNVNTVANPFRFKKRVMRRWFAIKININGTPIVVITAHRGWSLCSD